MASGDRVNTRLAKALEPVTGVETRVLSAEKSTGGSDGGVGSTDEKEVSTVWLSSDR